MEMAVSKKNRILVVDDMQVNREWVGRVLRKANFDVSYAENGTQALDILMNGHEFDLVLLDVEMPGINGFEVCQTMRGHENLKETPVIFLTSYAKIENKVFGFGSGAQDYVTKPFSPKELLVRINTHIQLKQKSDIIKGMNNALLEKNRSITDSIHYAQYIQNALLPSDEILADVLPGFFIFNKPKDIISGDFYWFKRFGDTIYFAVADCTGHGVPGAIMSVLGISMLNEIASNYLFYPPNILLNELRRKIINSLNHENNVKVNKDGMDIGLCAINLDSLVLQYSGAHIPLFILRKNDGADKIEVIKRVPDRLPVGKHPNDYISFTNHELDLMDGDRIYLFSDGYISQFGGSENKTFKMSRLVDLLVHIQKHPLKEQSKLLEETLINWQGDNEQADDILIIGLEVSKKW